MGFMADDVSGVLATHRPKQKSARCVVWDGDEVLEGLCEREKGEEERKERSRLEKSKANQEKLQKRTIRKRR